MRGEKRKEKKSDILWTRSSVDQQVCHMEYRYYVVVDGDDDLTTWIEKIEEDSS